MKKAIFGLAILSLLLILAAFSTKDTKPFKLPKTVDKNYVFIPMEDATTNGESTINGAFFISKYEVTNAQYNEFLASLKANNRDADLAIAMVDSMQWSKNTPANDPYVEYYHSHPAYAQYPVVNITQAGAELYCEWLSTQLNDNNPESGFEITIRLPSRAEWLRAATSNSKYSLYAWGGPSLRNAKGQVLCNYLNIGDGSIYYDEETKTYQVKSGSNSNMGVAGYLNDNADVTAPVNSYAPNAFGIYNLNGNVAEMTSEEVACGGSWCSPGYDVRNESTVSIEGATPTIGFRPVLTFSPKN